VSKFTPSSVKEEKFPWSVLIPENVQKLQPYKPGKPIEETERELGITGVIKLASNENPLGPSPKAVEAMKRELEKLHLYPDGSHYALKQALSKKIQCSVENISVGNGSDECVHVLMRAFVDPKTESVLTHQYAFVAYKVAAQTLGCAIDEVEVDSKTLKVSVDKMIERLTPRVKIVILANPNNPTGLYLNASEIRKLADACLKNKSLLVLDYAYWEFVENKEIPDPIEMFKNYANVLILRTFSKIYGIAGSRVGYTVAHRELIPVIEKVRVPFNVNSLALKGAIAALEDDEFVEKSKDLNRKSLSEIKEHLKQYPFTVFETQGNFLLVDFKVESAPLFDAFLKKGVILRPVLNYGLKTHVRISAGLPHENQKFFTALKEIYSQPMFASLRKEKN
jgi:histidinol-phosphate aminotransferase